MEELTIVRKSDLSTLGLYRKLWSMGWVAAGVVGLGCAFACGRAYTYDLHVRQLQKLRSEIEHIREEQGRGTAALEKAWANQQDGIRLIVNWAEYVRQREDISHQNLNGKTGQFLTQKSQ